MQLFCILTIAIGSFPRTVRCRRGDQCSSALLVGTLIAQLRCLIKHIVMGKHGEARRPLSCTSEDSTNIMNADWRRHRRACCARKSEPAKSFVHARATPAWGRETFT